MTTIRLATSQDADQIHAIYAPYVTDSVISFESDRPTVDDMRQRITNTLAFLPWLVCERDGEVLGYTYAGPHRARAAYQWAADVSVYVSPSAHRTGVGTAVYQSLFAVLRLQGFFTAYAGATLPNAGSVGLHESLGFVEVGTYEQVGYKHGGWHDVIWWVLRLQPREETPVPPRSIQELVDTSELEAALESGLARSKR